VEKTLVAAPAFYLPEKHLHGRGEDFWREAKPIAKQETPPWAWRRHDVDTGSTVSIGNTSTGVEKT